MTITLQEADFGTFLLSPADGRTSSRQADWDFPGLAVDIRLDPMPLRRHGWHDRLRHRAGRE